MKSKYKCMYCTRNFQNLNIYLLHLKIHRQLLHWRSRKKHSRFDKGAFYMSLSKRGHNICRICPNGSDIFVNFKQMWKHKSIAHEGRQLLPCRFCPKKFFWLDFAVLHELEHFTNKKRNIGTNIKYKNSIKQKHSMKHRKGMSKSKTQSEKCRKRRGPKVPCKKCGKLFRGYYLKKHMAVHTKEVKHTCEVCGMTFAWTQGFQRHQQKHNPALKKEINKTMCIICGKSFYNRNWLKTHERICDGIVKSVPAEDMHVIKHKLDDGKEIYKCQFCLKRFALKAYILRHLVCHTNPDRFKCPTCEKAFSSKRNLQRHQLTHGASNQPFQCSHCDARFTQDSSRKAHERKHTGERPYSCAICHKGFTQSNNHRSHEKRCHLKTAERN